MPESLTINGSCHCGAIRFALAWPKSAVDVGVRECGCTFCRKHNGAWTSHPDARLTVSIRDKANVSSYRFGTCSADFQVCARCGVVPLVVSTIGGQAYAVVNVNTFDDTEGITLERTATDFEGEEVGSRLQRRQRNWIPDLRYDNAD